MFLLLAVLYNMDDNQIESILSAKDMDLPKLHLYYLSVLLMTEEEQKNAMVHWPILGGNDREILDGLLKNYYVKEMPVDDKESRIRRRIPESKDLKANQIDEVLNMVKVVVPEDEILMLIEENKSAGIMRRYAEFFSKNDSDYK